MHEINFSKEFSKDFVKLETKAEKGNHEAKHLLELINKGIAKLVQNSASGIKIPKKYWPKEYTKKYNINNLWKINLDNYWRMIYTIVGDEIKLVSIVLEVLDHKKYDRKFGYKTS